MAADAPTVRPIPTAERVLVVPRQLVVPDPGWHGVRQADRSAFESIIERHGAFRDRAQMEADRAYKQVIPYLVLRDGPGFFLMHRTRAGGDARLHDRFSIGIGGHLNPGDRNLAGGLAREWDEEIAADFRPDFQFVGLLNDDTTDVGAVHLGAVFVGDAGGRAVAIRETTKLDGAFADPAAVRGVVDRMETWSAIVFAHLEGVPTA